MPYAEIDRLAHGNTAETYALFAPVIADQKYVHVYDLATKELLYTETAKMSLEVKGKDIKKLSEKAGFD